VVRLQRASDARTPAKAFSEPLGDEVGPGPEEDPGDASRFETTEEGRVVRDDDRLEAGGRLEHGVVRVPRDLDDPELARELQRGAVSNAVMIASEICRSPVCGFGEFRC